jgi:hypothetical protein
MKLTLRALKGFAAIVALAVLIAPVPPAAAQEEIDEASMAAAVELVEAADMDQIFDTVLPLFGDQIVQLVLQVKPELKGKFEPLVDEFLKTALTEGREEFMREMAKLYARRLTVAQMNDITSFYRTETGRKLVEIMPGLQVEAAQIGSAWGEKIALKTFERLRAKLKEDGHEF